MKMPRHLTVVYTINDEAAFQPEQERLKEMFKASANEPWAVTAMSLDHEMTRLSFVEDAHNNNEDYLIDEICGCIDIGKFDTLEDFKESLI
jgi:hypothetical protein